MQFMNQHTSKYQKHSKHIVCTRFPGSSMFCIGWQPDYWWWCSLKTTPIGLNNIHCVATPYVQNTLCDHLIDNSNETTLFRRTDMMQRGCDKVRPWRICVTGSTPNTPNLRPGFRSLPWLPCQKTECRHLTPSFSLTSSEELLNILNASPQTDGTDIDQHNASPDAK